MASLLVCINNLTPSVTTIEYINYDSSDYPYLAERAGNNLKDCYDEVYLVPFDTCHAEFIKEIRKHGKRL